MVPMSWAWQEDKLAPAQASTQLSSKDFTQVVVLVPAS